MRRQVLSKWQSGQLQAFAESLVAMAAGGGDVQALDVADGMVPERGQMMHDGDDAFDVVGDGVGDVAHFAVD
ncbi:MAG: hypothetical protein BWZ10_00507 [candidate division BRC1 bacterium ADurb.BinA364]|nr:MAG: hypothetical protein BWZ10_00507 [candidate division BRC1 bacterium ADurb.BinA364]